MSEIYIYKIKVIIRLNYKQLSIMINNKTPLLVLGFLDWHDMIWYVMPNDIFISIDFSKC